MSRDAVSASAAIKGELLLWQLSHERSFIMKLTTKQLVLNAVFAALFVILAFISVGTNDFKASFESLATLMAGITLGPLAGFLVGLVGEFIYQLIQYGLDPTTALWLIPYAVSGLVAGLIAKNKRPDLDKKTIIIAVIASELVLTILNTPVNAISAIIQGWGNWATILASVPLRLAITAVRIVVYIIIVPVIYNSVKKVAK